jgi:hypothetical protein
MADTDIDAVRKQKKAEYVKQYRLKRKLLLQQQASTSSKTELVQKQKKAEYAKQKVNVYLPSLRMKVPDHVYVLGHSYTCYTLIKYNQYA